MGNQFKYKTLYDWCIEHNRKDILEEWNEKKNTLTPKDVSYGSDTKIWWKCSKCNYEWYRKVGSRTHNIVGSGCPICAKGKRGKTFQKLAAEKNNLEKNRPDLVAEWHPTKNGNLKPSDFSTKSGIKVWWKCSNCGNDWKAAICSRSSRGTGCPKCAESMGTSFPEQTIFYYIKKVYNDAISRIVFGKYEYDVYIPSIKTIIEYDGIFWHSKETTKRKETIKDKYCLENNITMIRIRDYSLSDTFSSIRINVKDGNNKSLEKSIIQLLDFLGKKTDVNVERDAIKINERYKREIKENSLAYKFPQLAKEWHPTKNGDLKPQYVAAAYTHKVWWLCPICGYEWATTPNSRVNVENGTFKQCKKCSMKKVKYGNLIKVRNITTNKIYNSITEAAIDTNTNRSHISSCCKGKRKTTNGMRWEYLNVPKRTNKDRHSIINLDTNQIFDSAKSAANYYGKKRSNNIILCCKNGSKTAYGYHWAYHKLLRIINLDTHKEYDTYNDAAKDVGGDYRYIKKCCEHKIETAYGYRWSKEYK